MPLPLSDISQAYRSAPERTEQALTKVGIDKVIVRNKNLNRLSGIRLLGWGLQQTPFILVVLVM